ncbi:unnamed protein product, partial [marine sediment metagenome]
QKTTNMFSLDLISGINWTDTVASTGRLSITATKQDNLNNPKYDSLRQTVQNLKDKGENTFPFWIVKDGLCRDRPKK